MATFVLVPGAGGNGSYWAEVAPQLEARGHRAITVDIREDDPALGLPEYADAVETAMGEPPDVVLVGQSLGGFTVPMVAQRRPVRMIVLLNAMIPRPGETPGAWWDAVGWGAARVSAADAGGYPPDFDVDTYFLHDVPADVLARQAEHPPPREPADTPFGQPCTFERWPDVPIRVLVGRDDRFFPADLQRRVAKERLGLDADEIDGGHLVALSNARELAQRLDRYVAEL